MSLAGTTRSAPRLTEYRQRENVAVTVFASFIVTRHDEPTIPAHAPDHPTNTEFLLGVAVTVTSVPEA